MRRFILFVTLIFLSGFLGAFLLKITSLSASSPEGGCPIEVESTPSVVYDEVWYALKGVITTEEGMGRINFSTKQVSVKGKTYNLSEVVSGRISQVKEEGKDGNGEGGGTYNTIDFFPKLKVTQWRVEGHIHFPK
ncbi:MAG: hypothetical protein J7K17_05525 [Candidatus Omnitrophica bacterium]|nr:hypothetical protein [Candidatus Omnitrophota bacterium]